MNPAMTTTAFTLDGFRVTHTFGVVRGITVRSRSIIGTLGGSLQTLVGGNITIFTSLCQKSRACWPPICTSRDKKSAIAGPSPLPRG